MRIKEFFKGLVVITLQLLLLSVTSVLACIAVIGIFLAVYHLFAILYSIHISLAILLGVVLWLLYMWGLVKLFEG